MISVVVADVEPTESDSVKLSAVKAAVSDAKPLDTLRCSWAIWLTVMLFEPARADVVEAALKADVWLLLTANVLKSLASLSRNAASFTTLRIDTAWPKPLIFDSDSAILDFIRASAGALSAFTSASTIFFVSKPAPAPRA